MGPWRRLCGYVRRGCAGAEERHRELGRVEARSSDDKRGWARAKRPHVGAEKEARGEAVRGLVGAEEAGRSWSPAKMGRKRDIGSGENRLRGRVRKREKRVRMRGRRVAVREERGKKENIKP